MADGRLGRLSLTFQSQRKEFLECVHPLAPRVSTALLRTRSMWVSNVVEFYLLTLYAHSKFDTIGGFARDAESFTNLSHALYSTDSNSNADCANVWVFVKSCMLLTANEYIRNLRRLFGPLITGQYSILNLKKFSTRLFQDWKPFLA